MSHTITTNLEYWIYNFLNKQSKQTKKTKKSIIEEALKLYQKLELKAQIEAWLNERFKEYKDINWDFFDTQINSLKI